MSDSNLRSEFREELEWDGAVHTQEFFASNEAPDGVKFTQVQAVPFLKDGRIVLYRHRDGYFGLPGGQVGPSESYLNALEREILEECSCKMIKAKLLGFVRDTNQETRQKVYQLRYIAIVSPLTISIQDPAEKSIDRLFVSPSDANKYLRWKGRGKFLISLAMKNFPKLVGPYW